MVTDLSDLNPHHVEMGLNGIKVTFKVPVAPHAPTVPPMGIGHISTPLLLVWIPLHFGLPYSFPKAPLPSMNLLVWSPSWLNWYAFPHPPPVSWAVAEIYRVVLSVPLSQTWCKTNELLFTMYLYWGLAQNKSYMLICFICSYENSVNKIALPPERSRVLTVQLQEREVWGCLSQGFYS